MVLRTLFFKFKNSGTIMVFLVWYSIIVGKLLVTQMYTYEPVRLDYIYLRTNTIIIYIKIKKSYMKSLLQFKFYLY